MMENLLDVIPPPLFAEYLSPVDAINLGRTCSKIHSHLLLSATSPREILSHFSAYDRDDNRHYGFQIPVTSHVTVHSVKLSMNWSDQGWGNQKGRVFVVAEEQNQNCNRSSRALDFAEGAVAYSSEVAPHFIQRLEITFKPEKNKTYHLFYAVGGGGGHSLKLHGIKVQALVFDDASRCFLEADGFLRYSNDVASNGRWDATNISEGQFPYRDAMSLYLETILASTRHSLMHGLPIPPPTETFFRKCSVSGALTQKLIEMIIAMREARIQELVAYSQRNNVDDDDLEDFDEDPDFLDFDDDYDGESLPDADDESLPDENDESLPDDYL